MRPEDVGAPMLRATGLLSGWGHGLGALPQDARAAAGGRAVISAGRPALEGDRFRRATRECLLGVAAVEATLREAACPRATLAGDRTGLLYATASGYAAPNRAFIEGTGATTLHFPYTAPSAVPAEVAIEFGITGPYAIFLGGPPAALAALWQAGRLLATAQCDRVLVLAVETFEECADLYARARWLVGRPLVEAAACALLEPGAGEFAYTAWQEGRAHPGGPPPIARRLGEAFACVPLVELGEARAAGPGPLDMRLEGTWRGTRASLRWAEARSTWKPPPSSTS